MRLRQLLGARIYEAETPRGVVAVYAGRFHPFHKGHKAVFDAAVKAYGMENCWIATSGKMDGNKSPFSFEEKKAMMVLTGVPEDRIVECRVPYQPKEILENYDPETTVAKFMVGQKDMETDPRFKFGPKKDGSPSYLQDADAYRGNYETFDKHAYVVTAPTLNFKVLGKPATSATELRAQYSTLDDETAKGFITDLFGNFSDEVMSAMDAKLNRNVSAEPTEAYENKSLNLDTLLEFLLLENPWQGKDEEKAAAWEKLSPEDQKWLGNADPTDEFILNRAPNKGKPAPAAATGSEDNMDDYANTGVTGQQQAAQQQQAAATKQAKVAATQGSEDNMDDAANTGVQQAPAQQPVAQQGMAQQTPAQADDDEGDDEEGGDASYMANTDAQQATNQAQLAKGNQPPEAKSAVGKGRNNTARARGGKGSGNTAQQAAPGGAQAPAQQQQPQDAQQAQATAGKPVQPDPNAQKAQAQAVGAGNNDQAAPTSKAPVAAPATPASQGQAAQAQDANIPNQAQMAEPVVAKDAPANMQPQQEPATTKQTTTSGGNVTKTTTKTNVADYTKDQQQADRNAADVAEIDQEIADAQAAGDTAKVAELQKEKASLTGGAAPKAQAQAKPAAGGNTPPEEDDVFANMDAVMNEPSAPAAKPQAAQAQAQPQAAQTQTQKAPVDTKAGGENKNLSPPGPDGLQTLTTKTQLPQGYAVKFDPKKGNYIGVRPNGKGFIRSKKAVRVISKIKADSKTQKA